MLEIHVITEVYQVWKMILLEEIMIHLTVSIIRSSMERYYVLHLKWLSRIKITFTRMLEVS